MREFRPIVIIFLLANPFVLPLCDHNPPWPTEDTPNLPPVAWCNGDLTALVGEAISFDGSQSYDPDNTTGWFALTPLSIPRRLPASQVFEGRVHVFGGALLDPSGMYYVPTDVTEVYDPSTGNWSGLAPMPTAREMVTAANLDDRLYIIGGAKLQNGDPTLPRESSDAVEVYDPANDTWEIRNPLPRQPFQGWAPATSTDDTIIVIENTGPTYVYDKATDTWTQKTSVPVSIGNH
ncbi:MAG: hypothetical protein KAW09_03795, partial [Thermoplasmata archaeon]|nr:hypothetical protein [Thermoplasmata archaeon]